MKEFFKNLRRYKVSSVLNILGLSIAFASAFIILVQVNYDFSYNKCFPDADRVFRLELKGVWGEDNTWNVFFNHSNGHLFGENDDNVESFTSMNLYSWDAPLTVYDFGGSDEPQTLVVRATTGMPNAPQVIGFNLVEGDFERLKEPGAVILSESFAAKHGLSVDNAIKLGEDFSLTVVGIFKDFPKSCDLYKLELFMGEEADISNSADWAHTYYYKLISADQQDLFLDNIYRKYYERIKEPGDTFDIEDVRADFPIRLTAVEDTYFASNTVAPNTRMGNRTTTMTLLTIAVLIIVIAFVNFINFFMAMVPRRIRRVNTEKIFGCPTWRLRMGFVLEAMGLVAIALLLAAYLVFMIAPELTGLISTSAELADNPKIGLALAASGLVLAVISSIYPAYYITSMPAAFVIKGSFGNGASGRRLRYALLCVQFVISIALITCSLFVKLQHTYMMKYDMGFNKEHLLTTSIPVSINGEFSTRQTFEGMLKENPMIADVTFANGDIVSQSRMGWGRPFKGEQINFQCYPVAHDFLRFMGIKLTEGRDFMFDDERADGVLIFNESARKEFGLVLGDKVFGHSDEVPVVGFCEDFKFRPLQYGVSPFAFYVFGANGWRGYEHLYVRTTPHADLEAVRQHIVDCIVKMDASVKSDEIVINGFDKELGAEYKSEKKLTTLVTIFSLLSIAISLLGVFGLVYFETQYRRREIAVRRVHGAKIAQILGMFVGQYAKMVLVAFLFAVPVSYLIMWRWLQGYAYHIPLYWWVFALALLIVLAVTSAIVLARSWRAAKENPVEALYKE
ncbi:MAG: ABC transporter permease [Bacteroidaceae bacterium]|nr:ABC transporter permease [Bacteroidaceae bacterium]